MLLVVFVVSPLLYIMFVYFAMTAIAGYRFSTLFFDSLLELVVNVVIVVIVVRFVCSTSLLELQVALAHLVYEADELGVRELRVAAVPIIVIIITIIYYDYHYYYY